MTARWFARPPAKRSLETSAQTVLFSDVGGWLVQSDSLQLPGAWPENAGRVGRWPSVDSAGEGWPFPPSSFINPFTGNISKGNTDKGQGHGAHRLVRETANGFMHTFIFNVNASTRGSEGPLGGSQVALWAGSAMGRTETSLSVSGNFYLH